MASLEQKCEEIWVKYMDDFNITDKDMDNMDTLLYKASQRLGHVPLIQFFVAMEGEEGVEEGMKYFKTSKSKSKIEDFFKKLAKANITAKFALSDIREDISYRSYRLATLKCAELKKEYKKLKSYSFARLFFNLNANRVLSEYVILGYLTGKVKEEARKSKKCKIIKKGMYIPANPPKNPIPPSKRN